MRLEFHGAGFFLIIFRINPDVKVSQCTTSVHTENSVRIRLLRGFNTLFFVHGCYCNTKVKKKNEHAPGIFRLRITFEVQFIASIADCLPQLLYIARQCLFALS